MVRSPCLKILEIPGGRGVTKDPLERKFLGGGGCKSKSLPWWGYGYFLEPHNSVLVVWNKQNNDNYLFDEFSIMYGYHPENPCTFIFNYFILLSKRHVFSSKIDGNSPDICLFLETLKDKLTILRSIANSKRQEVKFKVAQNSFLTFLILIP